MTAAEFNDHWFHGHERSLFLRTAPRAEPSPAQRRTLHVCAARCRAVGLVLPTIAVHWVRKDRDSASGCAGRDATGGLSITLDVGTRDLPRLIYHELAHCNDIALGFTDALSRAAIEARADRFAAWMVSNGLEGW